ncbi:MAG: rhodanese-like domain-containing protein [Clostridia bacterium]|nr:rhodanese-like domain-containing protein [Clostridia bacterium]
MGFFDRFRAPDINSGVQQFKSTPGAVLVDVREEDEYREGRIPESINVPLSRIRDIENEVDSLDTPIFVYCLSGGRSARATAALVGMGYTAVNNIGGISAYKGKVER